MSVWTSRASSDAVLALAAFYGVGGLLCFVSLAVPAWPGRSEAVIVAVGALAAAVASALPLGRGRLSRRACYVLVALGSFLIAALVYAGMGGGASAAYAGFYVWVAVYSFLFFSPRSAAVQALVALLCEAAALVAIGEAATAPAQIVLSAGTILAAGAVVGLLAARLRALTLTDDLTGLPNRRALDGHPSRPADTRPGPPVGCCSGHRPGRLQEAQRRARPRRRGHPPARGLSPVVRRAPDRGLPGPQWRRRVHRRARTLRRGTRADRCSSHRLGRASARLGLRRRRDRARSQGRTGRGHLASAGGRGRSPLRGQVPRRGQRRRPGATAHDRPVVDPCGSQNDDAGSLPAAV
jgi:hypothetical protein